MNGPIRIVLEMQAGFQWIGGMEYIKNIILALAQLPEDKRATFEVSLLTNSSADEGFLETVRPHVKKIYFSDAPVPFFDRVVGVVRRCFVPRPSGNRELQKDGYDFIYPVEPGSGYKSTSAAAWIPDFQHRFLPELFTTNEITERDRDFSRIAKEASFVVLSSKSAEADFKNFYPEAAAKTKVLRFRIIPQPQWYEANPKDVLQKYHLPDKFFVICNQFWQHKNHLLVLDALKQLKDSGIEPVIVCTGHTYDYRKPRYFDTILQTIHKNGLARQVYLLGLVPKIDQIQLLRASIAVIQPSLFEGWSTIVEDARCFGRPVILSDLPVHVEQDPPKQRLFDRSSAASLASEISDCWNTLSPGPDLQAETVALEVNRKEVIEFGETFLQIAECCSRNSSC